MRRILPCFLLSTVIALPASAETDTYADATTEAVCVGWRLTGEEAALAELEERAEFTAREWKAIHQQKLFIGMSEVAAICARGHPSLGGTSFFPFLISLLGSGGGVGGLDSYGHTGNVTTEKGDWGTRTIYHYFYMELWIFIENGVVVNVADGDWHTFGPSFEKYWSWNRKEEMFEFEKLAPPRDNAWYVLSE